MEINFNTTSMIMLYKIILLLLTARKVLKTAVIFPMALALLVKTHDDIQTYRNQDKQETKWWYVPMH